MFRSTRSNASNNENNIKANEPTNENSNPENITLRDIFKAITKVDANVSTLSAKFDCLDNRTSKLEEENKKLKEDISVLTSRLSTAEFNINQTQEKQFEKYITISNIPVVHNENLSEVIIKAVNLLQVDINHQNITYCKRIGTKGKNAPLIIAELDTYALKETILEFAKKSGPLLPSQIYPSAISQLKANGIEKLQKIFINKYMTSYTHRLLQEVKKLRVNHTIEFIWQSSGIVFVRLTHKSKIFKLKSFEDLNTFAATQLNKNN